MGQINLPPHELAQNKLSFATYCQKYKDDPLTITVTADGEFLCRPLGAFSPDLPDGHVTPSNKPLGPFTPVRNNKDVVMIYRDIAKNNVHVLLIEIRDQCGP